VRPRPPISAATHFPPAESVCEPALAALYFGASANATSRSCRARALELASNSASDADGNVSLLGAHKLFWTVALAVLGMVDRCRARAFERRGAIDGDYRDRFRDFNRGACKPEASRREFDPALSMTSPNLRKSDRRMVKSARMVDTPTMGSIVIGKRKAASRSLHMRTVDLPASP
jgi:hypothetical protein